MYAFFLVCILLFCVVRFVALFFYFPSLTILCIEYQVHYTWNSGANLCREEENLVFWFGAQFISTLNFNQSGWLILFSLDLHFRPPKLVSRQTQSLWLGNADQNRRSSNRSYLRCFLARQAAHCRYLTVALTLAAATTWTHRGNPSNLWSPYEESQLNIN